MLEVLRLSTGLPAREDSTRVSHYRHDAGRIDASRLPDALAKARPAGFLRRAGGFIIDWFLAFFAPSLVSSFAFVLLSQFIEPTYLTVIWFVLLGVFVGYYFTHYAMAGQSPGMRVMRIRVVDAFTGQPPAYGRALVRGILTLLFVFSGPPQLYFLFNDPVTANYSPREQNLIDALTSICVITSIGYLWMSWDRRRRTLQDKIAGLAVIRAETPEKREPDTVAA